MSTRGQGRHRAPATAKSPALSFTQVTSHVSGNAGVMAKTGAVIAVSGGLVASLGLQAQAAPPVADPVASSASSADVQAASGLPIGLVDGVAAAPEFGEIGFTAKVKPKPKPKPKVVAVVARSSERVSRSAVRVSHADHGTSSPTAKPSQTAKPSPTSEKKTERTEAPTQVEAGAPGSAAFGAAVMSIAARYAGTMYRYGGTTPSGFDCSGYTGYVLRQVGITLPRTSSAQRSATKRISRSEAVPGDLVFMPGHVGIYAGNGMMWDSPRTGKAVDKRVIYSSSATYGRVG